MSLRAPLRIRISEVAIVGGSGIEARRLADALPASLDRAFARLRQPVDPMDRRRSSAADKAAAEIASAVRLHLEARE